MKIVEPGTFIIEQTAGEFLFSQPSRHAIYGILNLANGKVYIGSAVNVNHRFGTHKSNLNLNKHPNKHLQAAWNEYGDFAFEFLILENVLWKLELLEREEFWIELTNCCNPKNGYNKRKIPSSNLGIKLGPATEERKIKTSLSNKGKIRSKETIERISISKRGKKQTAEHVANVVKGRSGYRHTDATKAKQKAAHKSKSSWSHDKGYHCNCRECLDRKNLIRRLKRYNHEGEFDRG